MTIVSVIIPKERHRERDTHRENEREIYLEILRTYKVESGDDGFCELERMVFELGIRRAEYHHIAVQISASKIVLLLLLLFTRYSWLKRGNG